MSLALPVAMSSAGWAALGAVGGAVVGATAGGLIDWLLGKRRESALAKAGARLVAGEVSAFDSQLQAGQKDGKWWRYFGMKIDSWPAYRDVLAVRLGQLEFEHVSQGVMVLEQLRVKMPEIPAFRNDPDLPFIAIDTADMDGTRSDVARAYNALAGLAGHARQGDKLVHDRDD